jgi:hypothetical protein
MSDTPPSAGLRGVNFRVVGWHQNDRSSPRIASRGQTAWRTAAKRVGAGASLSWTGVNNNKLTIYLNDHLAGATAALELSRRIAANNRNNAYTQTLAELAAEIEADRDVLIGAMDRLSISRDRVKLAASWLAEKIGRLKLNGELVHYSPLSRLEELEILLLAVHGKLSLWDVLRRIHGSDPRLLGIDLDDAIARARVQRRSIERLRRRAAREALA